MSKIVIFGATSAIAIETARIYAERGSELFLLGRDSEKLESLKQDLLTRGAKTAHSLVRDLSQFKDHQISIEAADRALGGIDLALLAWGSLPDQEACERDFSLAQTEIFNNFLSPAALVSILANKFEAQGKGTIAVIGSVAGDRGRQSNYVYGSAKGALALFLGGVRNRLAAKGVQVLTIKPGFVDTPMTAHLKHGALYVKPEVVAKGIVRAIDSKRNVVYLPWFWFVIMSIIKVIPEAIFKKLKL